MIFENPRNPHPTQFTKNAIWGSTKMHSQTQSLCLFLFSMLLLLPIAKPDLASDRAALLALRSTIGSQTLLWKSNQTSPCSWAGINCENNSVTMIRLLGMALSDGIPSGIFGNLTSLRTLSLRLNALRSSAVRSLRLRYSS
ncbi:hypothetical protein C1H46_041348 [Malus baccata]|uniref:Leucine-rich repeat-containing N-terminal plant-type domain-containing protein n=1 Tax=Malus baccata TaxID=106549 RepID=A0A540KFW6_MALBA|nr:hypothetical protein C1H46_041348 [Malus baccata]